MCSVNDYEMDGDVNEDMKKSNHRLLTESDMCRKCQINNANFILRDKDFYCTQCFTVYFVHKFRSTIGKSREIKHGDKVLIAFSGGKSSTCLLHLIRQGLDEVATKKLQFHPHVLFVNESVLNTEFSWENIFEEVNKLNFPFSYTYLEEVLKEESEEISITTIKEKNKMVEDATDVCSERINEFQYIVDQCLKSRTSKEDFIHQLRYKLICRCAKQLGFKKVFLGCNGTELAVQIMSNVALGRGSQIADFVQFKTIHFGVEVFLPLRETFDDEVHFFLKSRNIFVPSEEEGEEERKVSESNKPSIVSCSRAFIQNLQKEFFSTMPTVFRTGSKLIRSKIDKEGECEEQNVCSFCGLNRDTDNDSSSSALNSIKLSKKLTLNPFMNLDRDNQESSPDKKKYVEDDEDKVYSNFCYGCANFMQELGYPNSSSKLQHLLLNKKTQEENLDIINDYLINED